MPKMSIAQAQSEAPPDECQFSFFFFQKKKMKIKIISSIIRITLLFFFGFPLLNWKYPEVMMYMGHMGSGIFFFFFFVKI